jgi:hypothetical protein
MAKVRMSRASGDDQVVETDVDLPAICAHAAAVEIDPIHIAEQDGGVLLLAKQNARRDGDIGW